jgi:hypothetical protein
MRPRTRVARSPKPRSADASVPADNRGLARPSGSLNHGYCRSGAPRPGLVLIYVAYVAHRAKPIVAVVESAEARSAEVDEATDWGS